MPRIITRTPLAMKLRERTPRAFPDKDTGDVGLFLGLHLVSNGSVAIFCGRKDSVTKLSRRLIDIYDRGLGVPRPIDVSDQGEIGKLAFLASLYLGEAAATHPGADDRVQELATHTLGYFLAGNAVRQALIETFKMIAASIRPMPMATCTALSGARRCRHLSRPTCRPGWPSTWTR